MKYTYLCHKVNSKLISFTFIIDALSNDKSSGSSFASGSSSFSGSFFASGSAKSSFAFGSSGFFGSSFASGSSTKTSNYPMSMIVYYLNLIIILSTFS